MYKYTEEKPNPLKTGMTFNGYKELAIFLGYKDIKQTTLKGRLPHYGEWHKGENNIIYIDHAFDMVKPFRLQGIYRYEIGDIIETNYGQIKILDRYKKPNKYESKYKSITYLCKCLKDDYEFEETEQHIVQGMGCPICGGIRRVPGIRNLYDEHPELMQFIVNIEDAKNISSLSNKSRILCKCPNCGTEREISPHTLVQYKFNCSYCSDYISYPNKFIRTILKQLNINNKSEKSFNWSNGKIYDEYLEDYSLIIETHGEQHYTDDNSFHHSLEEQQINDEYKYKIAKENGIKHYIVLDCRESNKEFIKNSVMNSELPIILNFTENDIDWNFCDKYASTNSEIKTVCEEYNNNPNILRLKEIFNHTYDTIIRYLLVGTKCGYCNYNKNTNHYDVIKYAGKHRNYPIYCITDNIYFFSKWEAEEYYQNKGDLKFYGKLISPAIKKNRLYRDKKFEYISKSEFNRLKKLSEIDNSIEIYGNYFDERYIKE